MSTATVLAGQSAKQVSTKIGILNARPPLRGVSLLLADLGALLAAAFLMPAVLPASAAHFLSLPEIACLTVPVALFCAIGLYSRKAMHPAVELRKVVCALALASIVLASVRYSSASDMQAAMIIGFLSQTACVICFRTLVRAILIRLGLWLTPAVIIGSGPLAQNLINILEKHKHIGLKPVAILTRENPQSELSGGRLLIEHPANASRLREEYGISLAIIAEEDLAGGNLETVTEHYAQLFDQVILMSSGPAIGSLSVTAVDVGGFLGLQVPSSNLNWTGKIVKRSLDLSVASLAAVVALPVFALLYIATRLSSPGPVFYGQRRIGQNGRYFTAWKFRSMVTDAEAVLERHLSRDPELRRQWELTHKLPNDPRVLPVGKVLRKSSLDELPQLWNVIRGEMSLVGPRPIVDAEVPRYGDTFAYYKMVRPGVTGMWQISGRSNTSYAERVRYDEYFVRNWSVWLDLYILFRTVKTVLLREGAC
jgi:Undecaprenyl-phosphate galactose phosphotransferase WbaP